MQASDVENFRKYVFRVKIRTPDTRPAALLLLELVRSTPYDILCSVAYSYVQGAYDEGGLLDRKGAKMTFWFKENSSALDFFFKFSTFNRRQNA